MNTQYTETILQGGLIVSALIVINQVLKNSFGLPSKYAVVVNLVLGIAFTLFLNWGRDNTLVLALQGLLIGASAGGLYDTTKLTRKADPTKPKNPVAT